MAIPQYLELADGAQLAYEIFGTEHLNRQVPIVLVGGMSSLRGDWERLVVCLAQLRPVLVFDHRGIGDSSYSTPSKDDEITIESMARDMLSLVQSLHWRRVILCGFSMGGVIVQQLLFLPFHPSNPTPLPFDVTHVLLTGTLLSPLRDSKPRINPPPPGRRLTEEEKLELVRPTLESSFDASWLSDPANSQRREWWHKRLITGRPSRTILKQARAMNRFDFKGLHDKLPRHVHFLIIHGELDQIVPMSYGKEIAQHIPWAKMIGVGPQTGQIPSLSFGHQWYEYFDAQIWIDVIEKFLSTTSGEEVRSRL